MRGSLSELEMRFELVHPGLLELPALLEYCGNITSLGLAFGIYRDIDGEVIVQVLEGYGDNIQALQLSEAGLTDKYFQRIQVACPEAEIEVVLGAEGGSEFYDPYNYVE